MKTIRCLLVPAFFAAMTPGAWACAACFGKSDSPMAKGMNAGIFTLLAVIAAVLFASATFFVFLARRASQAARAEMNECR